LKLNLDYKSLKFKIWLYFVLFAALLMLILWFLQIFFIKSYYEEMKIVETRKIARTIQSQYGNKDLIETYLPFPIKMICIFRLRAATGRSSFLPPKMTGLRYLPTDFI